jgi:hypothetical protein
MPWSWDKGTGIRGRDGSTPQELLASGGTPGHIFLRPADDYLRLFTDGKISLGVVPSVPLSPELSELGIKEFVNQKLVLVSKQ